MQNNLILFNSENASVMYLKSRKYMYVALEGFLTTETLDGFNKAFVKGVAQSEVKKFLFDTSKINVIKNEEMQWLSNNVVPYFSKGRASKIAFIKPENAFGNRSIETFSKALMTSTAVKMFPNMEQAEKWLFQD